MKNYPYFEKLSLFQNKPFHLNINESSKIEIISIDTLAWYYIIHKMKLKKLYAKLTKPLVNPPQMEFVKLSPTLLHNLNRFISHFPDVDPDWKFLWGRIIYKLSLERNIFQILNKHEIEWLCQPFCNLPHERYVQDFEIFRCLRILLKGEVIYNVMGGYEMYHNIKKMHHDRSGDVAQSQTAHGQEPQFQPQATQGQATQPQIPSNDNNVTQIEDDDGEYWSDTDGISEYWSDDDNIAPKTNVLSTDLDFMMKDNDGVVHDRLSEIDDFILNSVLELSKKDIKSVECVEGVEKNIVDSILDKSQKEIEDINSRMMQIQMNYIEDQTSATRVTSTSAQNDEIEDYCFYCNDNDTIDEYIESDGDGDGDG